MDSNFLSISCHAVPNHHLKIVSFIQVSSSTLGPQDRRLIQRWRRRVAGATLGPLPDSRRVVPKFSGYILTVSPSITDLGFYLAAAVSHWRQKNNLLR